MSHQSLIDRFRRARSDPSLAVLEGFHPLKHAIRFGAELMEVVSLDSEDLSQLAVGLAQDITATLDRYSQVAPVEVFQQLAPITPPTGIIAIARRPAVSLTDLLENPSPAPVVLLETPETTATSAPRSGCRQQQARRGSLLRGCTIPGTRPP